MAAERRQISTPDGRSLDVLLTGEAGAPTVVFQHGTPIGLVPLPSHQDPATYGWRTVLYVRPGYNGSTSMPGRVVADAAADVATLCDALGIDEFVTVGYSGGGPHALACAALLPGRCLAAASFAGISPYPDGPWGDATFPLTAVAAVGPDADAAREQFRQGLLSMGNAEVAATFPNPADQAYLADDAIADRLKTAVQAGVEAGVDGWLDDNRAFQLPWGFEVAACRNVTFWHGLDDGLPDNLEADHSRWLAEHVVGSALHLLKGEGHVSIARRLPDVYGELAELSGLQPRLGAAT